MQGSLIVNHPIPIWQVRLLFLLLAWAGGFTPFGCLQSLALNGRLRLHIGEWVKHPLLWGLITLVGGVIGYAMIWRLFPSGM
jgi:predicted cation transporter